MSIIRKHPDFFFCLVLSLIVLGITLPFLGHAYHIDEPLFLKIADHIKRSPLDPYGFYYMWNQQYEKVADIAAFPPLFSYLLAIIGGGYKYPPEFLIHFSLIPFALLAILSFYYLTRLFNFSPSLSFLSAALFAASPAFVISANLAMPDVASISLALFSLVLLIKGWKKNSDNFLVLGGIILGAAALMRYNAVPLFVIFFLLGLYFVPWKKAAYPSIIAIGVFSIWILWSTVITGESHTRGTLNIFANLDGTISRFWALNTHLTLSTFLPFLFIALWWQWGKLWRWLILFLTLDLALYFSAFGKIKRFSFSPDILFFGLGFATLIFLVVLFFKKTHSMKPLSSQFKTSEGKYSWVLNIRKLNLIGNKDYLEWALILWIPFVIVIPLIYVHFASKYLLFALPPLLIILISNLKWKESWVLKPAFCLIPLMLLISFQVARADFTFANTYRQMVNILFNQPDDPAYIEPKSPYPKIWFTGHWGWQYYLEAYGAKPLPYLPIERIGVLSGDLIITSRLASAQNIHPSLKPFLSTKDVLEFPEVNLLKTMNDLDRAGFYSDTWGPLPFTLATSSLERFFIYQVK